MATRAEMMAYANIKPCELPDGEFLGAVPGMPEDDTEEEEDTEEDDDTEDDDEEGFC